MSVGEGFQIAAAAFGLGIVLGPGLAALARDQVAAWRCRGTGQLVCRLCGRPNPPELTTWSGRVPYCTGHEPGVYPEETQWH